MSALPHIWSASQTSWQLSPMSPVSARDGGTASSAHPVCMFSPSNVSVPCQRTPTDTGSGAAD